jgi:2-haloacid dehalogenase
MCSPRLIGLFAKLPAQVDHAAARDIGFRCVWVDRGRGRQLLLDYRLPDYRPDAIIASLDQVPPLFAAARW